MTARIDWAKVRASFERGVAAAFERALSTEEDRMCAEAGRAVMGITVNTTAEEMVDVARKVAALEPIASRRIERAVVQSSTHPTRHYHLSRVMATPPGPWRCTCQGFAHRHRCKHVLFVLGGVHEARDH